MNRAVLQTLAAWHAEGRACALATIVAVHRSAPLPAGTLMAVDAGGASVGAVSGGCVEHEVIAAAQQVAEGAPAHRLRFVPDADGLTGTGLPCGGGIDVWVEPWGSLPQQLLAAAAQTDGYATAATRLDDGERFTHRIEPRPRVVIVGAGPLAAALCAQLRVLGRRTDVVDPREAFTQRGPRPHADAWHATWPAEALAAIGPLGPPDALLAISHHPALDDEALSHALAGGAGFVGALGSRAAHAQRLERLRERGIPEHQLARIAAPLGLDLGGWTPAETALAIAAELVAVAGGRAGGRLSEGSAPRRIHPRPSVVGSGGAR